ncbi:MAG: hypothetical protein K9G62_03800 [Alphaproteobacteria bacterium]|nr:hypothetical protein [Alphaproteobacteria bacterium]
MKLQRLFLLSSLLSLTFLGLPQGVRAQEEESRPASFPVVQGAVSFELRNNWNVDSDDKDLETNTIYTKIEPYIALLLNDHLAVETGLVLEPVQDTDAGDNTVLDNEGLFAEQLFVSWTDDAYRLVAGKFNPAFGMAWDLTPGIWGNDFAEDYETTEKVGFGGSVTVGDEQSGEHTLSAATFFAETSFLSDSLATRRGPVDKSDGGVSNTEDFSSYTLALDSAAPLGVKGLTTHAGFRSQAAGDADIGAERESAYALGVNYTFPLAEGVETVLLAEWAGIRNLDGTDDDVDYLTGSAALEIYERWNVVLSHTNRDMDVRGGADADDRLSQLSAGYAFENGLTLDLGYRALRESGVDTQGVGALVGYLYEF